MILDPERKIWKRAISLHHQGCRFNSDEMRTLESIVRYLPSHVHRSWGEGMKTIIRLTAWITLRTYGLLRPVGENSRQ